MRGAPYSVTAAVASLGGASVWNGLTKSFLREYWTFLVAGVVFSLPIPELLRDRFHVPADAMKIAGGAALLGLTFIAVTYVAVGSYNPFIYFNF